MIGQFGLTQDFNVVQGGIACNDGERCELSQLDCVSVCRRSTNLAADVSPSTAVIGQSCSSGSMRLWLLSLGLASEESHGEFRSAKTVVKSVRPPSVGTTLFGLTSLEGTPQAKQTSSSLTCKHSRCAYDVY